MKRYCNLLSLQMYIFKKCVSDLQNTKNLDNASNVFFALQDVTKVRFNRESKYKKENIC